MPQSWLIIERYENWQVDFANNFSFFGLSDRYKRSASEIAVGDLLFCYVSSGKSSFSDIRLIQEKGLKRLKVQSYDSSFANSFSTKPVLVLPEQKWLPIKEVVAKLDLTRDRKDYRPMFQTSLRKLSQHDANLLEARLRAASTSQGSLGTV